MTSAHPVTEAICITARLRSKLREFCIGDWKQRRSPSDTPERIVWDASGDGGTRLMFGHLSAAVAGFVVATISAAGYPGIVGLMAIESACVPLPSEIIMPFSGYLVSTGRFDLILVATAGALGCNVGSTVAYAVGLYGGRPLVERWGSYILVSRRDLGAADRFFARYGGIAVLVGRLLPIIRTFIALPAGIARLPQLKFQVYTFVGSWPWCFGLAYIGYRLGQQWDTDPRLHALFQRFDWLVAAVILIGAGWYLWRHLRHDPE